MSTDRDGSISSIIKEKTPISEVAERFSISRPTLYKYMDCYDQGEFDRIPKDILEYFRLVGEKDVSKDDSNLYLMAMRKELDQAFYRRLLLSADMEKKPASFREDCRSRMLNAVGTGALDTGWSDGSPRTLCVGHNGRAMVIFSDAFDSPDSTVVLVSVDMDGEDLVIGRYVPDEGMNFVNIDNLLPKLEYMYRVEQRRGVETVVSETRPLRLR